MLRGVVEQVRKNLSQPHRIGIQINGIRRNIQHEIVIALFDQRPAGFNGNGNHRRQFDFFSAQFQHVPADPVYIQQIIDQSGHVLDLPIDKLDCPSQMRSLRPFDIQNLYGIAYRAQADCAIHGQASPGIHSCGDPIPPMLPPDFCVELDRRKHRQSADRLIFRDPEPHGRGPQSIRRVPSLRTARYSTS